MKLHTQKIKVPAMKAINLFLLLFLLLGIVLWGIVSVFYRVQFRSIVGSLTTREVHTVNLQKIEVENNLSEIVSDLLFISRQNELQNYFTSGEDKAVGDIEKEYRELALRKKKYDQIRYLDTLGQEIVRVNYNGGSPAAVAKKDLQNKGKRYYFTDAFRLKQGEIFISPLDLNIEHGELEQPLKPMLRLGTPVFDANGSKRGIVLINYLAQVFLDVLKNNSKISKGRPMLVNREGYWLLHGEPEKEWGFMIKGRENVSFAKAYPEEWQTMLKQKTGQIKTENGLFTFATVYPLEEGFRTSSGSRGAYEPSVEDLDPAQYFWVLVSHVSPAVLKGHMTPLQLRVFLLGIGLFILVTLGAWFLALAITKRRIYQSYLVSMALHDALTSLPNRKYFFDKLEEGIAHAQRYGNRLGLLYIDLDGFKAVNDTSGHEAGDELLVKMSERMLAITRKTDTVARLGGDEFAILLFQVESPEGVQAAGEKLIQEINRPVRLRCGTVTVGASIGARKNLSSLPIRPCIFPSQKGKTCARFPLLPQKRKLIILLIRNAFEVQPYKSPRIPAGFRGLFIFGRVGVACRLPVAAQIRKVVSARLRHSSGNSGTLF